MRTEGLYVPCPVCGKIICKARFLMQMEVKCSKCRSELLADVGRERRVTVEVVKDGMSLGA